MKGYPEYYTIVYRDDQRVMILEDNPKKRVIKRKAPPKRGASLDQIMNKGIKSNRNYWRFNRH